MNLAKQSTAKTFLVGPILDSDGAAKTDEVVASIKVTKNGSVGAPNGSSTLTHNHTGHYLYAANAGDLDTLGEVTFSLNSGTNAMAPVVFQVVSAAIYDSLVAGTDYLPVDVTQWKGATAAAMTGDAYARLGAPAGASTSADIAAVKAQTVAIEADTQDLQAQVGTDGAGLTDLPWNADWDTEVQSEVYDALNAAIPGSPTADSVFERIKALDDQMLGPGAHVLTVTCVDAATNPLENVRTWISTDAAGETVVTGPRYTNAVGVVTFSLEDDVDYYICCYKSGYTFTYTAQAIAGAAAAATLTGAAAGSGAALTLARWSISTLKAQVLGELNQDRNTQADAPDRLKNVVAEALRSMWRARPFAFREREDELAASDGDTTEALPGDFREMLSDNVKDVSKAQTLKFTTDRVRWRVHKDHGGENPPPGHPTLAIVRRDMTDTDDMVWLAEFDRELDQDYTWPIIYLAECPIDLAPSHADFKDEDAIIPMPTEFHELWHLEALYRAQRAFRADDAWKSTYAHCKAVRAEVEPRHMAPHARPMEPIRDGYQDMDAVGYGDGGQDGSRLPNG